MSKYSIDSATLTDIADAIRAKDGTANPIAVSDFADRIELIEAGGSIDHEYTKNDFVGYGNTYGGEAFSNNRGIPILEQYGDLLPDYIGGVRGFCISEISTAIQPRIIEISVPNSIIVADEECFMNQTKLERIYAKGLRFSGKGGQFYNCASLKEVTLTHSCTLPTTVNSTSGNHGTFESCIELRTINGLDKITGNTASTYVVPYRNMFMSCICLDEIKNLGLVSNNTVTTDMFTNTFSGCKHMKAMTFASTTTTYAWSNQSIKLNAVGYGSDADNTIMNAYRLHKLGDNMRVTDAASYAALKDETDWWTSIAEYSRYNHDSAVETINSLPDVSSGSSNTIVFYGIEGANTEGGAINTLTEEELAVATAKGWTVSIR